MFWDVSTNITLLVVLEEDSAWLDRIWFSCLDLYIIWQFSVWMLVCAFPCAYSFLIFCGWFIPFMQQEKERAMVNEVVAKLTSSCWDKCVTGTPGSKFSSSEYNCLSHCAKRYMEMSMLIMKRVQWRKISFIKNKKILLHSTIQFMWCCYWCVINSKRCSHFYFIHEKGHSYIRQSDWMHWTTLQRISVASHTRRKF